MTQSISSAPLDIGRVISRTFSVIGGNFAVLFGLSMLLVGIPTAVVNYGVEQILYPTAYGQDPASAAVTLNLYRFGAAVILWLPSYILLGAVTHCAVVFLNGSRASIGECLGTGLSRMLPLLGFGLLSSFGIGFFTLLLIIPGLMAATRWAVGGPAVVVEKAGATDAFERSRELTRGNRWLVFWLIVIWIVAAVAIELGVSSALGYVITGTDSLGSWTIWAYYGISSLYAVLSSMIGSVGAASLYTELRTLKEGATSEELAKVFE